MITMNQIYKGRRAHRIGKPDDFGKIMGVRQDGLASIRFDGQLTDVWLWELIVEPYGRRK